MVGIGLAMIAIGLVSLALRWYGRLYDQRWFLRLCILASPLGFFAVTFGWITTEHGRQPWVIYGQLRTADSVSPIPLASVATSLALFVIVYCLVFGVGTYYLLRLMRTVPSRGDATAVRPGGQRPIAAADEPLEDRSGLAPGTGGVTADGTRPAADLGRHHCRRRDHVRDHGRLRSRRRDPVPVRTRRRPTAT